MGVDIPARNIVKLWLWTVRFSWNHALILQSICFHFINVGSGMVGGEFGGVTVTGMSYLSCKYCVMLTACLNKWSCLIRCIIYTIYRNVGMKALKINWFKLLLLFCSTGERFNPDRLLWASSSPFLFPSLFVTIFSNFFILHISKSLIHILFSFTT